MDALSVLEELYRTAIRDEKRDMSGDPTIARLVSDTFDAGTQLASVYRKLGVQSRSQLAIRLFQ